MEYYETLSLGQPQRSEIQLHKTSHSLLDLHRIAIAVELLQTFVLGRLEILTALGGFNGGKVVTHGLFDQMNAEAG